MTGLRRRLAVVLVLATSVPALVLAGAAPAGAASSVVLTGHGYGHGRGLGQWGSLGYALQGSSSAQILDHFYGGTVAGQVGPSAMSVRLEAMSGQPLRVQVGAGGLVTDAGAGPVYASSRALLLERVGPSSFRVSDGPTCAGPWTPRPSPIASTTVRILATRGASTSAEYGFAGDIGLMGDWNRDGFDTVGVFRPGGPYGRFFLRNANSSGPTDAAFEFGFGNDVPLVGDWNGDGIDTVGVFRRGPGEPRFYLRDANSSGPVTYGFPFGWANDIPIVGDWDGDGRDSIGVFRPGGPYGRFFLRNALSGGPVDHAFEFGFGSDRPVVGDWDGIGGDGVGVRRGSDFYLRNALSSGPVHQTARFGSTSAQPLAGDWNADGVDTLAVREGATFVLTEGQPQILTGSDEPLDNTLQLCTASATTWYRGELRAVDDAGAQQTVNVLDTEFYLRGVVPRESPASWGALGCEVNPCRGMQALQAQAVAARSYALAENRRSYAKTCDTISCQVYGGRQQVKGGATTLLEDPRTNAAIAATDRIIRLRDGAVARTEFSSSTGGFTAGGVFPAVVDAGDAIASNPHHNWTVTLSAAQLEARYGHSGFQQLVILGRSPLDGRRVTSVRVEFASGSVTRTGDQFRLDFGLRSTWFDAGGGRVSRVGVSRPSGGGQQFFLRNAFSGGPSDVTFSFGNAGDVPLMGDWNGDGIETVGVFRPGGATGRFFLRNSNTSGIGEVNFEFGFGTDLPVVGDWNGDGVDTIGVFRPSEGRFYVRNANSGGPTSATFNFGLAGDVPLAGDWDGDGRDAAGVFRNSGGTGRFLLRNSLSTGPPDADFGYGFGTDRPIVGDWNGDRVDSPGVYRSGPTVGTFYLRNVNSSGPVDHQFEFGLAGDRPNAGAR